MKVVLSVDSGSRIRSQDYYKEYSYWYPNYKKNPILSHKDLAQVLEEKYSPMAKFAEYLNGSRDIHIGNAVTYSRSKSRFTDAFLEAFKTSNSADSFKIKLQNKLVDMWRYWLTYNLGHFHQSKTMNPNPRYTGKKTPLVDTKQYMTSIFFNVKYVGRDRQQMSLIYKYYSTANSRQNLVKEWLRDPEGMRAELDFDTVRALGI